MDMDWRSWTYGRLQGRSALVSLLPSVASIFGSGSLTGAPAERPFVIFALGTWLPELKSDDLPVSHSQFLTVAAHDEPGDYARIDAILVEVREAISGQVSEPGAICATFQGLSQDLADDHFGTAMRNAEFRLTGRND